MIVGGKICKTPLLFLSKHKTDRGNGVEAYYEKIALCSENLTFKLPQTTSQSSNID
jgi:hypothetical protein